MFAPPSLAPGGVTAKSALSISNDGRLNDGAGARACTSHDDALTPSEAAIASWCVEQDCETLSPIIRTIGAHPIRGTVHGTAVGAHATAAAAVPSATTAPRARGSERDRARRVFRGPIHSDGVARRLAHASTAALRVTWASLVCVNVHAPPAPARARWLVGSRWHHQRLRVVRRHQQARGRHQQRGGHHGHQRRRSTLRA